MRKIEFVAAVFSVLAGSALAAPDTTTIPEMDPAPVAAQAMVSLPVAPLVLAEDAGAFALDRAKSMADTNGLYVAASEAVLTDAKYAGPVLEANVAAFVPGGSPADPMNLRFYGTLLIFAAGCIMYLGLTVRRHP